MTRETTATLRRSVERLTAALRARDETIAAHRDHIGRFVFAMEARDEVIATLMAQAEARDEMMNKMAELLGLDWNQEPVQQPAPKAPTKAPTKAPHLRVVQ